VLVTPSWSTTQTGSATQFTIAFSEASFTTRQAYRPPVPSHPSLDGRAFASDADVAGGDVGPATVFHYRETPDGVIEARYAGGAVRVGNLVGTRDGDELRFRYAQVRHDGSTATGRCTSVVTRLGDGRLAMQEDWAWESEPGTGTSRVVELLPPPEPPEGIRPIGRVAGGRATIRLDPLRFTPEALRGLDAFSHVEVLYRFVRVDPAGVHIGARRPRGNPAWPEVGIFAQRAEDRPNRLGTSVCRLVAVRGLDVDVEGLDAVDGTPVLDLKPCIRGPR
jgi:tRNA (adenine37-N6)-methyltransferase